MTPFVLKGWRVTGYVQENVEGVRIRMARAAERAGRDPGTVRLVAVTKSTDVSGIRAAYEAGLREFGENRVADAADKLAQVDDLRRSTTWHLVGHLQRNKVQAAIGLFDIIESVDSERLAERIDRLALTPFPVLLEVNISREQAKHGFDYDTIEEAARRIQRCTNIDVRGLMTMAPKVDNPEEVRPFFRAVRDIGRILGVEEISMGMTNDFEVAIEEGATMVRVGRAIFSKRNGF